MSNLAWDDAFSRLWTHAARHRGMAARIPDRPGVIDAAEIEGWPRTRGADVLAIASVVDAMLRAQPIELGGYAIERRWHACTHGLMDHAVDRPHEEYVENHVFWETLTAIAAYLASLGAPVPEDPWNALLAEIARVAVRHHRNAVDDRIRIVAPTYDDLWREQQRRLARLRGSDRLTSVPPFVPGPPVCVAPTA